MALGLGLGFALGFAHRGVDVECELRVARQVRVRPELECLTGETLGDVGEM